MGNLKDFDCNISYNENEEMMLIKDKNDKTIFYGNYWDFNKNPQAIGKFLTSLGLKVNLDDKLRSID